jgi:hypothetical protein
MIRVCVMNDAGLMTPSRLRSTNWRGTRDSTDWAVMAQGQRHCGTLMDVCAVSIEVQGHVGSWQPISGCGQEYSVSDPKKNADLIITGTGQAARCAVQQ